MFCHCGLSQPYSDCCGRFITGQATPETAEALMRSRYTAYFLQDADYLLSTTAPGKREEDDLEHLELTFEDCQWLKLEVRNVEKGRKGQKHGKVEFIAYFETEGQLREHHEISDFVCIKNRWYYFDGALVE